MRYFRGLALFAVAALALPGTQARADACITDVATVPGTLDVNLPLIGDISLPLPVVDLTIAVGGASSAGTGSTSCGPNASADGANATAVGDSADASGDNSSAFGQGAEASGENASAFGQDAVASGDDATAIGQNAQATGLASTALGVNALASGENATALGQNAAATGADATAVGQNAGAAGAGSTALGQNAQADAVDAIAIGHGATVAAGAQAGIAIGAQASAAHVNSVAIGANAQTQRDNQIVYGTASQTHTAPGITSDASRAAQQGPLQLVTSDADGNLGTTDGQAFLSGIDDNDARIGANSRKIGRNTEGIAMAFALSGVNASLPADRRFAVSGQMGFFGGEHAAALGAVARIEKNALVNAGFSYGLNQRQFGGRAGLTFLW